MFRSGVSSSALTSTALTLSAILLSLSITGPVSSSNSFYRHTGPDGTVVFSDVPSGSAGNGIVARNSYRGSYGRPTATASCKGMNAAKLAARQEKLQETINSAAKRYDVDPRLVVAIARVESCFDSKAVSSAGAKGVMQLMPKTALQYGITQLFDIEYNIEAGVRYFSELSRQYDNDTRLALAAYNAGPGAVAKYGGIPPYPETQKYVLKVLARYDEYNQAQ